MEAKKKNPLGSKVGRKPGPLSNFTRREQDMLKILNRMSSRGASDLALVVMINECRNGAKRCKNL